MARYSHNASTMMAATTSANSHSGAQNTIASTTGISTTAVRTRFISIIAAGRRFVQAAVTALALLEFLDGLKQVIAAEVWPVELGDINFRIRSLPEQEVAEAHLAASSDHQIELGQMTGVHVAINRFLDRKSTRLNSSHIPLSR